jgi:hypothetical protein
MTPSPRRCPRAPYGGPCSAIRANASNKSKRGGRPHQRRAQAHRELQGRHLEAAMRLPPKMTPAQIADAQRMMREWKRLGAPGKSRSECALDERAAPREGSFARPTEPAGAPCEVGRCAGPACPEPPCSASRPRCRRGPVNQLVGALATAELESEVAQVTCDLRTR